MKQATKMLRVTPLSKEDKELIDLACNTAGLYKAVFYKVAILTHAQSVLRNSNSVPLYKNSGTVLLSKDGKVN